MTVLLLLLMLHCYSALQAPATLQSSKSLQSEKDLTEQNW